VKDRHLISCNQAGLSALLKQEHQAAALMKASDRKALRDKGVPLRSVRQIHSTPVELM
jgi:hypothetical protein